MAILSWSLSELEIVLSPDVQLRFHGKEKYYNLILTSKIILV